MRQVSDTVKLDAAHDTGASNRRRIGIVYADSNSSGFEVLHGLVRSREMWGDVGRCREM